MQPIEPIPGVVTIRGDIRKEETVQELLALLGGPVDVVLSDMSPNISGSYSMDNARSIELCEHALAFARKVLRPGGAFVVKVFEGDMMPDFLKKARASFQEVKLFGPQASRSSSSEIYVVARHFTG